MDISTLTLKESSLYRAWSHNFYSKFKELKFTYVHQLLNDKLMNSVIDTIESEDVKKELRVFISLVKHKYLHEPLTIDINILDTKATILTPEQLRKLPLKFDFKHNYLMYDKKIGYYHQNHNSYYFDINFADLGVGDGIVFFIHNIIIGKIKLNEMNENIKLIDIFKEIAENPSLVWEKYEMKGKKCPLDLSEISKIYVNYYDSIKEHKKNNEVLDNNNYLNQEEVTTKTDINDDTAPVTAISQKLEELNTLKEELLQLISERNKLDIEIAAIEAKYLKRDELNTKIDKLQSKLFNLLNLESPKKLVKTKQ